MEHRKKADRAKTVARPPRARGDGNARPALPTLTALATFVAVVDNGSFSNAADALGVSQPTVSFQVGALEAIYGTTLVRRKPQLVLTDAGRELLLRARLVLGQIDDLASGIDGQRRLQRGSLRFGFSSPGYALPLLARFMERHPGITVDVRLGNTARLLEDVDAFRIDAAIMTLAPDHHRTEGVTELGRQDVSVWLCRDDPLAARPAIGIAEVVRLPLLSREAGSMTRAVFERACLERRLAPAYRLVLGSREALREAVAAGLGVGIVLGDEVGPDPRLVARPVGPPRIAAPMCLVHLPEMAELPVIRALVGLAVERDLGDAGR